MFVYWILIASYGVSLGFEGWERESGGRWGEQSASERLPFKTRKWDTTHTHTHTQCFRTLDSTYSAHREKRPSAHSHADI